MIDKDELLPIDALNGAVAMGKVSRTWDGPTGQTTRLNTMFLIPPEIAIQMGPIGIGYTAERLGSDSLGVYHPPRDTTTVRPTGRFLCEYLSSVLFELLDVDRVPRQRSSVCNCTLNWARYVGQCRYSDRGQP